ncbi:MAG TPA: glycosyltransferase family 4 protein [Xanthobacteraceae bacterium]|jgi:glycosyltransferase involved in cell wall biosynthesis
MRAPLGGLLRHVLDLARGQIARGHRVGLVADATRGGGQAEAGLARLAPALALGLTRVAMSRQIGLSDVTARAHVARRAAETNADVVHGHGAKGGAYARLISCAPAIRVYTPHGGSLHYRWTSPAGCLYLAAERLLLGRTDLLLFESAYGCAVFEAKLGKVPELARIVHNGVAGDEFKPVLPAERATDLVFVGELRVLKGVDVLIEAIASLSGRKENVTATIVGEGRDRGMLEGLVLARGLSDRIHFAGPKPAREAFALGRILIVPSRAESLPYIVLEAAAAGVPMIATRVGGIGEIFGDDASALVPAGDVQALASAIENALREPGGVGLTQRLQRRVHACFSAETMTDAVLLAYRGALSRRHGSPASSVGAENLC